MRQNRRSQSSENGTHRLYCGTGLVYEGRIEPSLERADSMAFDNTPEITPKLISDHGLKPDEFSKIVELIGRQPTLTELGIFSAMWNEHCSYKSSK